MRWFWRHNGATMRAMPSVQIKNVPEDVHRVLRTRAAAAGQSLQEYLLALLVDEARHESLDAWLDRVGSHSGGSLSLEEAVEIQRELRRGG
jgi:plasmid stability protein